CRIGSHASATRQGALQLCCGPGRASVERDMADRSAFDVAGRRWLAAVGVGLALAGCARTCPEPALRNAVAGLAAAVEARDAGDVAAVLTDDFIGPGGLDRDGARRLAALHFMRHGDVGVVTGPMEIELQDAHARVRFSVVLSGGSGGLLPDAAEAWQL